MYKGGKGEGGVGFVSAQSGIKWHWKRKDMVVVDEGERGGGVY